VSETGQALGDSGQGSPLIAATDGVAASVPALVPVTGAVDQVAGSVLAATTTANLPGETLGPVLNVANETTEPVSALVGASADGIGSLVAPVIATVDSAQVSPITTLLDVVNSTIHPLAVAVEDIASGTLSPVVEVVTDVVGAPSTVIDDAIAVPSLTPSATPTAGPPGSVARPSTASLAGRDSPAVIEPAQWPGSLLPRPDYESQGLGSLEPNASPIATVTRSATSEAAASQTRDGSPVSRTREALSWVSGVVSGERVTSGGPAGLSAVLAGLLVLLLIPAIAAMANVALLAPRSPSFVPVHPPD
jgi:hypothetical protein